eukprot:CAMPEP_0113566474 /NCGR_PEP_ID=MMETSP0015_2-20120614/22743_1 /TAXON_ID=2838 /ORGANISM="Odontella" /LENGTH=384 /DNA_ID=CAMNT_0000468767 /DNA_START=50 /DNA_END=1204 /DNA_ORIENTATION=- /assembly_acc=CAM_ASM_000160
MATRETSHPSLAQKRPRSDYKQKRKTFHTEGGSNAAKRHTVRTPHHGTISYVEALSGESTEVPSGHENSKDSAMTVLFLHGIQGSARSFRLQLERFSDTEFAPIRVLAMDLPGYGETDSIPPPKLGSDNEDREKDRFPLHDFSHIGPYYADAVVALLDALSVSCLSMLVGHSMGGLVAQLFADRHPLRLERLVISSSYVGDGRSACSDVLDSKWTMRLRDLRNLPPKQYGLARAKGMVADPEALDSAAAVEELASIAAEVTSVGLRGGCNLLHVADTTDALKQIRLLQMCRASTSSLTKVLVLIGERDKVVTAEQSRAVMQILSSSSPGNDADASAGSVDSHGISELQCMMVTFPSVAHAAYIEDAEAYNRALADFLKDSKESV